MQVFLKRETSRLGTVTRNITRVNERQKTFSKFRELLPGVFLCDGCPDACGCLLVSARLKGSVVLHPNAQRDDGGSGDYKNDSQVDDEVCGFRDEFHDDSLVSGVSFSTQILPLPTVKSQFLFWWFPSERGGHNLIGREVFKLW